MSKLSGLAKTAYQSDTPKKYLIDAATLYKNLTFDATTQLFSGELIGATNGGIEIDLEQKYRDVEVDGTYWTTVKGNKVLSSTSASAKTSIKEFTAETLRLSINGTATLVTDPNEAPTGYSVVKGKRYVDDSDYIDNVGMVGKLSGTNKPIIVIFDNVLATAGAKIKTEDDKEAEIPVELQAHASYDQLVNDEFPYRIYFPTMSDTLVDSINLKLRDVNADPAQLVIGQNYDTQVDVTPTGGNIADLLYLSTDKDVATVNQAGTIHITGQGAAEIIVLTKDGEFSDTLAITGILPTPITGIASSPDASTSAKAIQLIQGDRGTIAVGSGTGTDLAVKLNLTPANANNYTIAYSSDDDSVTVDAATGEFEAVHGGISNAAAITVLATNLSDGSTQQAKIFFKVAAAATGFSFTPATIADLSLGGTKTDHGTINLTPAGAKSRNVTMTSGDPTIATVVLNSAGTDYDVTGVAKGSTKLTVKVDSLTEKKLDVNVID
ncbi:putative phage structural protein [Lactococcus phage 1358]|uniref:Putative phage structural protein n=1 Tax=Lactococcus phage 1358 TaxID=741942 RepID=D3W0E4_9CAUD|nr:major tail protein [Lactococcus phage 1358]ADD25710.1 putative phage structural protein [Lactococcus phage 1358]